MCERGRRAFPFIRTLAQFKQFRVFLNLRSERSDVVRVSADA